jgi:hypothetical protein
MKMMRKVIFLLYLIIRVSQIFSTLILKNLSALQILSNRKFNLQILLFTIYIFRSMVILPIYLSNLKYEQIYYYQMLFLVLFPLKTHPLLPLNLHHFNLLLRYLDLA